MSVVFLLMCQSGCGSTVVKIKNIPVVPPISLMEEVAVPVAEVKKNKDLVNLVIDLYKAIWKANGRLVAIRKYIEEMEAKNE